MVNRQSENLQRLALIAGLKRDAESQALARVNTEIQSRQAQVTRLRNSLRRRGRDLELDPSRLSGADVHWVRRTEQQIITLQAEIARFHVEREILLQAARLAVGRAQVVDTLVERSRVPRTRWE